MTTDFATPRLKEIASGVFAMITPEGGANAGFIVGGDQVLVVDTRMTPSLTRELLVAVRGITTADIRYLVNTHYHGDHVFGNQFFPPPTAIVSHTTVRDHLARLGDAYPQDFARRRPEFTDEFRQVRLTLPFITFTDRLTIYLGDRAVELVHLGWGHTDGDCVVYLPTERVAFVGDLLFHRVVPALMDARSRGWIEALDRLAEWDIATVVPGHGLLATKAELAEQREFLVDLWQAVRATWERGMSEEQAMAEVRLEKYAAWLNQERLPVAVQRVFGELFHGS